jgi:hypothetical protein
MEVPEAETASVRVDGNRYHSQAARSKTGKRHHTCLERPDNANETVEYGGEVNLKRSQAVLRI